jgi:hypothetical protein
VEKNGLRRCGILPPEMAECNIQRAGRANRPRAVIQSDEVAE